MDIVAVENEARIKSPVSAGNPPRVEEEEEEERWEM